MKELINKRGLDSKVFDTGRFKPSVYEDVPDLPVYGTKIQNGLHDIEPNGSFVDIDPLFEGVTDGDETDRVRRTRCGRISIGNKLDQSKDSVKVLTKNGCGIRIKLKGYRTYGPHFDDLRSTYFTTNNGITLKYYPKYNGVKLVIVVDNPQVSSNVFRFRVKEIGCSYTYEEADGGIKCISSTGKDNIYIKSPYAVDANGDHGNVRIRLDGQDANGNQIFKKVVNPVWYGNAVGPVEVDPDVTIDDDSGTLEDAVLLSSSPGSNAGARAKGNIYNTGPGDRNNVAMKVGLTSLPPGATIVDSYFGLDVFTVSVGPVTTDFHKLLRDWNEGNKDIVSASAGEVTWTSAKHSQVLWTTAGAMGNGTDRVGALEGTFVLSSPASDVKVQMTNATTQDWIDTPANNNGLMHTTTMGTNGTREVAWRSSETVTGVKPYFYAEFTIEDGADRSPRRLLLLLNRRKRK